VLSPLLTHIDGPFPAKLIDHELSFPVEGHQFHRAFLIWKRTGGKSGWDGRKHLLNKGISTFPTGLLSRVRVLLDKLKLEYRVEDHTKVTVYGNPRKLNVTLRPYQEEAVKAAIRCKRGVLCQPTGGGKTLTVIALHARLGLPTLVLVHTRGLVQQWKEAAKQYLGCAESDILILQGGKWVGKKDAPFVIAGIQSLISDHMSEKTMAQVADVFKRTQLLVADECHHTSAATFLKVVSAVEAPYRIGVSATPYDRADATGMLLEGYFGPIIHTAVQEQLVEDGHLAQGMVAFLECDQPRDLEKRKRLTYSEAYKAGVVHNDFRNKLIIKAIATQVRRKKRVLCLVKEIVHGWKLMGLAEEYLDIDRVAYVTASTPLNIIQELKGELDAGNLDVLIASPVFGEGTDLPSVDVVVIADSGKSTIGTTQKIGRGTRTNQGKKDRFLVIDVLDTTHKYLINHAEKRVAIYEKLGLTFIENPRDAWVL
jgi:superfamily II DNA or RNA helicase